jgi:hypothetical protein
MELGSREREVEYKTVFNEDGSVKFVKKSEEKKGRKSRSKGGQFEIRVRKDLEEKGYIVDKWTNNVDLDLGRVVASKRVFKPLGRGKSVMTIGTGFPDFITFQKMEKNYKIIGVEVKVNGNLDREEKEKCRWLVDNEIFSEVWVAKKVKEKNRVRVEYVNSKEILERMRK